MGRQAYGEVRLPAGLQPHVRPGTVGNPAVRPTTGKAIDHGRPCGPTIRWYVTSSEKRKSNPSCASVNTN